MRILGIDFGSHSIKAVEFDIRFGRFEIHDYHEKKVIPGQDPRSALHELVQALPKQPDRIAMCLPSGDTTMRTIELPTKNRKAIHNAVPFEIEDDLPFSLNDAVIDYCVLGTQKQRSQVHVAIALKKRAESFLKEFESTAINPDILTSEAWAYRTFFQKALPRLTSSSPSLLVHIGHTHTTIYAQHLGAPVLFKTTEWGAQLFTSAIGTQYGLSGEQAEKAKIDHAFILTEAHKTHAGIDLDQIKLSETLFEIMKPLVLDIRQALLSFKRMTQQSVGQIYLTGAPTLMPGLRLSIEDQLKVPTECIRALSILSPAGINFSDSVDASFLLAAGVGLVAADRGDTIHFRKHALAKESKTQNIQLEQFKRPAQAAAAVIGILFVSLMIQDQVYSKRMEDLDTRLEKSMRTFFGYLSKSALKTYLTDTKKLREAIQKELQTERDYAALLSGNPTSPIEFLNTLSQKIPKALTVDLIQTTIGSAPEASYQSTLTTALPNQTVTLTFLLQTAEEVGQMETLLSKVLTEIKKSEPEKAPSPFGDGVRLKVQFTGKPKEDAYGTH